MSNRIFKVTQQFVDSGEPEKVGYFTAKELVKEFPFFGTFAMPESVNTHFVLNLQIDTMSLKVEGWAQT